MKNYFAILKRIYGKIYRISLFILTSLIILYFYPKEGKFKYEFQKGSPWLHENLNAPYNFPIYKFSEELGIERDSIEKEIKPYFKYNNEIIYAKQMNNFRKKFKQKWEKDLKTYDSLQKKKRNKLLKNKRAEIFYNKLREKYEEEIIGELDFIYEKGIIEIPYELDKLNQDKSRDIPIVIIKNKIAEEYDFWEVFTEKTAYEYILRFVKRKRRNWKDDNSKLIGIETKFFEKLNINNFLKSNIFYDKKTTKRIKKVLIEEISLTSGMIQIGERIISNGDIVTEKKYKILESLRQEYEANLGNSNSFYLILFGQFIIVVSTLLILYIFLVNFRKDVLKSNKETTFILFLPTLMVGITHLVIKFNILNVYVIPYVLLPIIIRTFYTSRFAWFVHLSTILVISFLVPNGLEFMFIQSIVGIIAIFTLKYIHRRGQLFITSLLCFITYGTVYFGIAIMQEGDISKIDFSHYAWFAGSSLLLLTSYPLIYLFEKMFGFLSDITLMEISDTNHPLLRKLAQRCPGTFQHSIQVGNLAEEVVYELKNANHLLVRTGAYFHDIGKIENPDLFIENQVTGINPHSKLDFQKSAEIIISHVENGIKLAEKYNIPNQIIDFIRTHHGTTKVQYFLRSMKNKYPNKKIDESKFTYPGIKPYSKETAVLMMADSIEAASRSLKEYSKESISNLVENIINYKINEEQLTESNITFKEIITIKRILKKKIENIYHGRIEYPKNSNEK